VDWESLTLAGASRKQLGPGSYPCPLRFAFSERKRGENSSTFAVPDEPRCKETSNQRSLLGQDKEFIPEEAQGDLLDVRVQGRCGLQRMHNQLATPPTPQLRWVYQSKITAVQLRRDMTILPTT